MIRVLVTVSGGQTEEVAGVLTIVNRGPVAPDEGWDSGGERRYFVEWVGGGNVTEANVRHFRRDGLLPLLAKAFREVL